MPELSDVALFQRQLEAAALRRRMLGQVDFAEDADRFTAQRKLGPDASDPAFHPAEDDLARLFATTSDVLGHAIELSVGSEQFLHQLPAGSRLLQRRKDGRCPRCGAALRTPRVSGRTACYCARCQDGGARRA